MKSETIKLNISNCAIFGGIGISEEQVDTALKIMSRGNDGTSIKKIGNVILGHRRHKIISDNKPNTFEGESDQPYYNNDKSIALIFNGELFNNTIIKNRLSNNGYEFTSFGDTEVLLNSYLEQKDEMFKDKSIDFMFAIAIVDLKRKKLILARDWPGRIPLFILNNKKNILFSSEIKGLLSIKNANIKDIQELPPGHMIHIDLKYKSLEKKCFYIPEYIHSPNTSEEIGKKLLELLDNSCEKRLVGDKLPCLLFSGGLDSLLTAVCTIRAARKKGIQDKLTCYVFALEDYDSEDVWRAKRAFKYLERLGIELKEIRRNKIDIIEATPDFIYLFEAMSPLAVSFYPLAIYYFLAEEIAKDGFKAAIGGDGPDELLGAYDSWKELDLSHENMSSYEQRHILMERIHETILKRGSIMMMNRGPVEMRFPFLETHISEYLLSIHPKWLTESPELASTIKNKLENIRNFDDKELKNNFYLYLDNVSKNLPLDFPLLFEYDKLFWKLPLFMAGLEICHEMNLEPDILISPKLRSQHGAGLTSLEDEIINRFQKLQPTSDKDLFIKIWKLLFEKKLLPNDIKDI